MARGSGIAQKVNSDLVRRYTSMKALWLAVQNDPELTVQDAAVDFYYAVGELLEGKPVEQIEFRKIDRARVIQHSKES